jgi:starch-binding outer membrane protein SusE/F
MRKIVLSAIALLALAVSFTNCKKQEDRAIIKGDPGAAVVNVPSSTFTVDSLALPDSAAYTFSWSKPNFGVALAHNYTLQIAKNASDLGKLSDSSIAVKVSAKTEYKATNAELRALGAGALIAAGTPATYYARVISEVSGAPSIKPLVGDAKQFTMVYYNLPLVTIWVPGSYQGFDPATAPVLYGIAGSDKYEGIIEKSKSDGTLSDGNFKFASIPSWTGGVYYGDGGAPKKLSADGGANNLNLPDGTYFMKVDTKNLTYDYELRSWGIIGDATPNGWGSDMDMRYDGATGNYIITLDLIAGSFKVRFNDGWAVNRGWSAASGKVDGDPIPLGVATEGENNGKNFGVVDPGNYTVAFNPTTNLVTIVKN